MFGEPKRWYAGYAAALLAIMAGGTHAEADPENLIKYRQGAMSALGGHMGASAQIVRGKVKRLGRNMGQRPSWKKAIVTLKAGDAIELFEEV